MLRVRRRRGWLLGGAAPCDVAPCGGLRRGGRCARMAAPDDGAGAGLRRLRRLHSCRACGHVEALAWHQSAPAFSPLGR